jgi:hypothetical protein
VDASVARRPERGVERAVLGEAAHLGGVRRGPDARAEIDPAELVDRNGVHADCLLETDPAVIAKAVIELAVVIQADHVVLVDGRAEHSIAQQQDGSPTRIADRDPEEQRSLQIDGLDANPVSRAL